MAELPRSHVSAGTFQVSKTRPIILQAYLGTCVGLAMTCGTSGVGGMIHLLLPEPISSHSAAQPEKYATTGVPLFIDALVKAGARKASLFATIAGGALVGPISRQDLNLDIGGRTSDRVREILEAEGIQIERSETGGFFTCCLSLDMTRSRCDIEPAGYSKLVETTEIKIPAMADIKKAMDQLRPIPQVALKVMRIMDGDSHYQVEAIADEIRKDQVISARVLKLANSAIFGAKRHIDSLDHALIYLGRDLLLKLVISAAVQSFFNQEAQGYSLCKGGLYDHAVGCAQVAEAIARKTGKIEPAKAYTAGLLHDIGKVVLDQYVASAYPLFYRQVFEEGESFIIAERRLLGIDHTQVGYLLARQWSFPSGLVEAIRHHHFPDQIAQNKEMALIVHLADLLLSRFRVGIELERVATHALPGLFKALDLRHEDFDSLVDLIPMPLFKSSTDLSIPDPGPKEMLSNQ